MAEDQKTTTTTTIWWETSKEQPLPEYLEEFPALALEVADNIALATCARMCRKGAGWDFYEGCWVDPRLRNAEYSIDREEEEGKLQDVFDQIKEEPAHQRPAFLMAFHRALQKAYTEFQEPAHGTDWDTILHPHAHCCLGRWYYDELGLLRDFVELWYETLLEFDNQKLVQEVPDSVVQELLSISNFLEEGKNIAESTVGKVLAEKKKMADEEYERELRNRTKKRKTNTHSDDDSSSDEDSSLSDY